MPKKTPTSLFPRQPASGKKSPISEAAGKRRSAGSPVEPAYPKPDVSASDLSHDLTRRFRIAEVAESFGVRPRTVRSWIEKGLLEREKIGNSVFIRGDQIDAMLRASCKIKQR